MRLSDEALRCVVFLGRTEIDREGERDIELAGTGFFLLINSDDEFGFYLVTARHIANGLTDRAFLRLNSASGGYRIEVIQRPQWHRHPESDIAILDYHPPDWASWTAFPHRSSATALKIRSKNLGPGDLVYVVGLFRQLAGDHTNFPIVHTGHIAMVPQGQKIKIRLGQNEELTDGLIVEAQATSGCSGSPVFVRRSLEHTMQDPMNPTLEVKALSHGSLWLLGVWSSSHWGTAGDLLVADGVPSSAKVSVGLGVVVPTQALVDLLDDPSLVDRRRRSAEARRKRSKS